MRRLFPLVALFGLACSDAPRRSNTVILASGADLQSANPLLTTHSLARQVQRYALLVTLVQYDSTLAPIPYLARRWQWSGDRTSLTMWITQSLRWHDGVPTTAKDAAWTLNAARDVATGYPRRADLAGLTSVRAPDDTTLTLTFTAPRHRIPDVLTDLAILPAHVFDTIPPPRLRASAWNQSPVGNGPFRFVKHEAGRRWVFEANRDFPAELGGPPRLDRFVVAVVDEPTTKLAALTSGELDLAGINPAHAAFVSKDPQLRVLDYPLLFSYALVFNTRRPPFDRLAARQAVSRAINRRAIVDGVLFGYGTPGDSALPPATHFELQFELLTVGSGEAALEQMLQAQLAEAGIRAEIRQLELSTYLDRVDGPAHEFDAAVIGLPGDLEQGQLNRLVAQSGLRATADIPQLLQTIRDSIPAAMLYHARGVQGVNRRVEGIVMDLRGELVTLSQWSVSR